MTKAISLFIISGLLLARAASAQEESAGKPGDTLTAASRIVSPEDASALPGMAAPKAAKEAKPAQLSPMDAEWNFLKTRAASTDEDILAPVLQQLEDWVAVNPAAANSAEAQLLKASLRVKLGDQKAALTDLFRYFYEYPGAPSADEAKKLFAAAVEKKADKKLKPVLQELAVTSEAGDTSARLASMLEKVSSRAGEFLYKPLLGEYRAFFLRFPGYAGGDILRLALADLHQVNREYLQARLAYEAAIEMYPASPLIAGAKASLAANLADNLKDYDGAIAVYQDIAASFPGTDEAWTAYSRLPALTERQDKFALAVEIYEKIITLYPDREEAYGAFKSEARVLREELKNPSGAMQVLSRLADKYKGPRAIEALFLSAEIARKDLKDTAAEVQVYDRIVAEYPADAQAPRALFAAGEAYEKAKDYEKAREYYSSVSGKYSEDPLAKKAQKRIDGLLAR